MGGRTGKPTILNTLTIAGVCSETRENFERSVMGLITALVVKGLKLPGMCCVASQLQLLLDQTLPRQSRDQIPCLSVSLSSL